MIEIMMILNHDEDKILGIIDSVLINSDNIAFKRYNLLAKKYRYKILSQNKRLYNFLEKTFLPYMIEHNYFDEAKQAALELAEHFSDYNDNRSSKYYKTYIELTKKGE